MVVGEPSGLRQAAIEWLLHRTADGQEPIRREDIADFRFQGEGARLIDQSKGIWKPRGYAYPLSIVTTFTAPGKKPPYEDSVIEDGFVRYAWEGGGPNSSGNVALRNAMRDRVPVVWFIGVGGKPPLYQVVAPVYIVSEDPERECVVVAPADPRSMRALESGDTPIEAQMRIYQQQTSFRRLHQPVFRNQVLTAYEDMCAVCSLRHRQLLDAAHIVSDSDQRGIASVVNGLAMCKIHHAAFDSYFLGVRPDLTIEIRKDLLGEVDGPMLRHGLQELHGTELRKIPEKKAAHPSVELLEIKYDMFRKATAAGVA